VGLLTEPVDLRELEQVHPAPSAPSAWGYCRVSTEEQGESGLGLAAQRSAIEAACAERGLRLAAVREEVRSSARADNRPELQALLRGLRRGDVLVVSRLDRLTRSLLDIAALVEQARRRGWTLVVLDLGLDLSTPTGEAMAGMLAVFAQFERRLIGQRTRDALAAKRATGWVPHRFESPLPEESRARALELAAAGISQRRIADALNREGIPTGGGGRWHRESVRRALSAPRAARP
jgi:DNA invertase Pin-like site-specific DNA recombinase